MGSGSRAPTGYVCDADGVKARVCEETQDSARPRALSSALPRGAVRVDTQTGTLI